MINNINNGKISSQQFLFAIAFFIQGGALITSFFTSIAKQDSWFVILTGFAAYIPFLLIILALIRKFPRKNLLEINDKVYGKFLGKVISIIYLFFFLTLSALNLRDAGGFVNGFLMPQTPSMVILFIFMFMCAWAVRKGLETIVRYSEIAAVTTLILTIMSIVLSFNNIHFTNFLPVFSMPLKSYIQGTNILASIPYGEIVVFLLIAPAIKDQSNMGKALWGGLAFGAITLLMIVSLDTTILGNAITYMLVPTYETLRMIHIGEAISRMEVFFAIIILFMLFFKVIVIYYCVTFGLAQLFSLKSYRSLVIPIGAIMISYSILVFQNASENISWGSNTGPIAFSLVEMILPALTLLIVKIKEIPGRKKEIPI